MRSHRAWRRSRPCSRLLDAGAHVVAGDDLYGGTFRLFERVRKRSAGHAFTFVDMSNLDQLTAALRPETKMVWVETPSNPLLKLADLAAIAKTLPRAQHRRGRRQHVRESLGAAPARARLRCCRAFNDEVSERTLGHHRRRRDRRGDERLAPMREQLGFLQNAVGAIAGPFDSFLTLRGIKTLALRMQRHCENALALAHWLEAQPKVKQVRYPGLPSHPHHALARDRCTASAA